MEYANLLNRRVKLPLPATLVFDHPTTAAITTYLASKLAASRPVAEPVPTSHAAAATATSPTLAAAAAMSRPVVGISSTLLCKLQPSAVAASASGTLRLMHLPTSDAIRPVPRWDVDAVDGRGGCSGGAGSTMSARFGAFMDGVADFDNTAFGLIAPEALAMDPQHRLLLERVARPCRSGGPCPATTVAKQAPTTADGCT